MNKILVCMLLISIFVMSIGISNSTFLSFDESLSDEWQTIGNYDEILEDMDKIITAPLYLCVGDSIRLNLTVIPQESQFSGVKVKIHTPESIIYFAENRTSGIKTVNHSVLVDDPFIEGNYWFEVLNPGGAGGDKMRVFGQCSYYHVDVIPDPATPYDAFQVGDWLIYDVDYLQDVQYTVTSRDSVYIQFESNNPYSAGWDTIIVPVTYHPSFDDSFYSNIMDRYFLPFNYNLSTLEEVPDINPVFYYAQTLIQTDSGVIAIENTIVNGTTVIKYITTIEYTITEIIPVKGINWKYEYYNNTDDCWTNYSVRMQVHEPTGIPIFLDMTLNKTDDYSKRVYYRLIDSHGVFKTKEFPTEDIIEYISITEYITEYIYITVTETTVIGETEIVYKTSWITKETIVTKQSADFVSLSFIALAIVVIVAKRRNRRKGSDK